MTGITGMSRTTGAALEGEAHLAQSVADILSTLPGTRVARRDYGSALPLLADQPLNPALRVQLYAASALALSRWEPRLRVSGFRLTADAEGKAAILVSGRRADADDANALTRLLIPLA